MVFPAGVRGTTSAHAENTPIWSEEYYSHGNYLRARGEYRRKPDCVSKALELPPRTRRIHTVGAFFPIVMGTTSAHAENTLNQLGLL